MHKIVLTFDDGPVPEDTARILDCLAEYKLPALFFVVGERLANPASLEIVHRAAREGHLIGNHSFSHPNLTELSAEEVRWQIARTHDLVSQFEPRRKLFRPPYGASNDTVKAIAKELGYEMVFWNASSEDWRPENASSAWVNIAIDQISTQHIAICLCHDRPHTAEHLPQFLERVRLRSTHKVVSYYRRRDLKWFTDGIAHKARVGLRSVRDLARIP